MSSIKCITLEEEMKRNPQLKLSDIQLLREWCKKQPHLPKVEDTFFALCLHRNNYQMEPTKNTIENYFTTRTHLPEFFCNRDPLGEKRIRQASKAMTYFPLEEITKDGYKKVYGTYLEDPTLYDFNDTSKYYLMLTDIYFLVDGTTNGHIFFFDASNLSFGHFTRMNPFGFKKYLYYLQEAAPFHIKEIHIINTSSVLELVLNMIKPFMKKELLDVMYFHSSLEDVSKYISVDKLPNEAGGKAGSIRELTELQMKMLEEYREWFLLDETTRRVDETKRIGKSKSANELFGVEVVGKLDID
ncbi:PREDICTED: alpha-tocopherol transfer protein-like [Wasmannia auropunctata]|uniref:alpha-tocopherol transfer protein-like n=1 Tax=Wasmannia auropunctata TaxID=64793 RepID=UPI0005EEEC9E|nr:PREDICTED: alpha-tocopherol transfer protein-like [Wasmannia auropunctata]